MHGPGSARIGNRFACALDYKDMPHIQPSDGFVNGSLQGDSLSAPVERVAGDDDFGSGLLDSVPNRHGPIAAEHRYADCTDLRHGE